MSWRHAYRVALHLLPADLRCKHGSAMEALFVRDVDQARTRGWLRATMAGCAGIWDVVRRGAYEHARQVPDAATPLPTARQLLGRHAASFGVAFTSLTMVFLANYARKLLPALAARGEPAGTMAEALLLAIPFIVALTIPMSVFFAVLWQFTRLETEETLTHARERRSGVRQLVVPLLRAATLVAVLAFVVTAEIVPRANQRLTTVLDGHASAPNVRSMTIAELQAAARTIEPGARRAERRRLVAVYEVEVQKKFALPAACVVMALAAMALALAAPRLGTGRLIAANCIMYGAYYALFITGESLASRLVIPPYLGMWGADALLFAVASLAVWRFHAPRTPDASGPAIARR